MMWNALFVLHWKKGWASKPTLLPPLTIGLIVTRVFVVVLPVFVSVTLLLQIMPFSENRAEGVIPLRRYCIAKPRQNDEEISLSAMLKMGEIFSSLAYSLLRSTHLR
jgi:hypothetical protein